MDAESWMENYRCRVTDEQLGMQKDTGRITDAEPRTMAPLEEGAMNLTE